MSKVTWMWEHKGKIYTAPTSAELVEIINKVLGIKA